MEIETLFNFLGSTVGAFRNAKRLGYPPFSLDSAGRDALAEKRGYRGSSWVPLEFYDLPAGHFIVDLDWEDWEALQEE